MTTAKIIVGDARDKLENCPDGYFDLCFCDPPYGLSKQPNIAEVLDHWDRGDDYYHRGGGMMGLSWDSFVPGPSLWKQVHRTLKPDGKAYVFAGTRTMDLMMMSLERAGFFIEGLWLYIYGTGFPKSMNIAKAIDKKLGAKPKKVGENPNARPAHKKGGAGFDEAVGGEPLTEMAITEPVTEEAKRFDGYGTALKPAYEPIIVVSKQPVEQECECKFYYSSKVSKKERNEGIADLLWVNDKGILKLVSEPDTAKVTESLGKNQKLQSGNPHPTLKPIKTIEYFLREAGAEGANVCVPFSGAGSEVLAAIAAQASVVVGIEIDPSYAYISTERIQKLTDAKLVGEAVEPRRWEEAQHAS